MTMMEVEYAIRRMISEARSGHNDGWTQAHFRKELVKLQELITEGLKK